MATTVFISYSHQETAFVDRLKHDLSARSVNIWIDHESLTPGTRSWEVAIRNGIRSADLEPKSRHFAPKTRRQYFLLLKSAYRSAGCAWSPLGNTGTLPVQDVSATTIQTSRDDKGDSHASFRHDMSEVRAYGTDRYTLLRPLR
jgi:TIR domain